MKYGDTFFYAGPNYNYSFDVEIKATNNCGTYTTYATIQPPAPIGCLGYSVAKSGTMVQSYIIVDPCSSAVMAKSSSALSAKMTGITTEVTDINGRKIIQTNSLEFSLDRQLPGTYYVRIIKNGKVVHTQTIIKN